MSRILLVEDEHSISEPLARYLRVEGFEVLLATTAAGARSAMKSTPSLVVLDWMLPDGQGIDLLRGWRMDGVDTPVIFLSARADTFDKVLALELGADDYLTKPFEPRELLARIRARLRQQSPSASPSSLRCANLTLWPDSREVQWRGQPLQLTLKEFDLLHLLLERPNRVFTRDEILNSVWGYDCFPTTRTVDTHILQLRRKTDADLFESIRGVGYRLNTRGQKITPP